MNGLQTAHAPSPKVVVPHFIAGGLAFLVMAVLMFLSASEWISLYYHPKLIAITHIGVLGWATMIALGALYQLIPVIYETSLYSEKLAKITFLLYVISLVLLSYSFWITSYTNLLFYSSLLMFFSLLLFVINLVMTYKKSNKSSIQSKFIASSIYWLGATELLGTLIAMNFKLNFLSDSHLHYLKVHAHLGMIGWFLLLIIGASSVLIPMFMISHETQTKKLNISYYLINLGLIGLSVDWLFFNSIYGIYFCSALIILGIAFYLSFVYKVFKTRLRKKLDTGLKLSVMAVVFLLIPVIISLYLIGFKADSQEVIRVSMNYGLSVILGVISTLILGQIYKTLPFIIWLERYQKYVGKYKTPLPRELYSEQLAKIQMYLFLPAYILMMNGIFFEQLPLLKAGILMLIVTAFINLYNILKIVFHKVQLKELQ